MVGENVVDAPVIDHATTTAAVVSNGDDVEIAETPLPDPTVKHATPAGSIKLPRVERNVRREGRGCRRNMMTTMLKGEVFFR